MTKKPQLNDQSYLSLANSNAEASCEAADFITEHDRDLCVQGCKLGLVSPHTDEVISNATVYKNINQPMQVVCMASDFKQHSSILTTFRLQAKKKQKKRSIISNHFIP
jgi:hypothetical protein